jgi:hypothetical protein
VVEDKIKGIVQHVLFVEHIRQMKKDGTWYVCTMLSFIHSLLNNFPLLLFLLLVLLHNQVHKCYSINVSDLRGEPKMMFLRPEAFKDADEEPSANTLVTTKPERDGENEQEEDDDSDLFYNPNHLSNFVEESDSDSDSDDDAEEEDEQDEH